jgi:hypothetical protein
VDNRPAKGMVLAQKLFFLRICAGHRNEMKEAAN